MNNRQHFTAAIKELKEQMALGPVEILSGPCAPLVVKDKASLHEYACLLDEWMYPSEPRRVERRVAKKPTYHGV
jgi:hypothetical protein